MRSYEYHPWRIGFEHRRRFSLKVTAVCQPYADTCHDNLATCHALLRTSSLCTPRALAISTQRSSKPTYHIARAKRREEAHHGGMGCLSLSSSPSYHNLHHAKGCLLLRHRPEQLSERRHAAHCDAERKPRASELRACHGVVGKLSQTRIRTYVLYISVYIAKQTTTDVYVVRSDYEIAVDTDPS